MIKKVFDTIGRTMEKVGDAWTNIMVVIGFVATCMTFIYAASKAIIIGVGKLYSWLMQD